MMWRRLSLIGTRLGPPGGGPGKVDRNPMDRIPRAPQPPGRYIEVFTDAEIATLTSLGTRDGTLMAVMFDAGLRKAESRRLRAEHCLLERQQLVVVGGKGGKDRVIPMTSRLAAALADLSSLMLSSRASTSGTAGAETSSATELSPATGRSARGPSTAGGDAA